MKRENNARGALGVSLYAHIKSSKVLMVGAGGIGCELLKNLLLTGFGEIHIVDLDTIDLSNLNRQFLFGMQHIKKSKAMVAKETAGKFNPNVKLEAYHADITSSKFNVAWFRGFDLVFNALDNLAARRHVNAMCLAANVPLVESGTTGFNGQVQVIKKGETECYDCTPKPVVKSFPVCTIRSTPSQPIHCIVWAKSYLFNEIFGQADETPEELNQKEDAENAQELENLRKEAEELKKIRETLGSDQFAKNVFDKVFDWDVQRLLSMKDMWKTRKPPIPLRYEAKSSIIENPDQSIADQDQLTWSLEQNIAVFADSLKRLSDRVVVERDSEGSAPVLSFDKDDVDTLDFVAASANLRSFIFGIDLKSKFDIKQMAGNIIPAIATTNAITAGLCVMQAFKVLRKKYNEAKMVFLSLSVDRAMNNEPLRPPNPSCEVCGILRMDLEVDTARATLGNLVEDVLMKGLEYEGMPTIIVNKVLIYDSDYDDNLEMTMADLKIQDGTVINIVDESDENPKVNIDVYVNHKQIVDEGSPFVVPTKVEIPEKIVTEDRSEETASATEVLTLSGKDAHDTNSTTNGTIASSKKRKLDEVLDSIDINNDSKKRSKPVEDDVIVIDDGIIEID